jgi:hypothetical protein
VSLWKRNKDLHFKCSCLVVLFSRFITSVSSISQICLLFFFNLRFELLCLYRDIVWSKLLLLSNLWFVGTCRHFVIELCWSSNPVTQGTPMSHFLLQLGDKNEDLCSLCLWLWAEWNRFWLRTSAVRFYGSHLHCGHISRIANYVSKLFAFVFDWVPSQIRILVLGFDIYSLLNVLEDVNSEVIIVHFLLCVWRCKLWYNNFTSNFKPGTHNLFTMCAIFITKLFQNFLFIINYCFDIFRPQFLAIFREVSSLSIYTTYMVS